MHPRYYDLCYRDPKFLVAEIDSDDEINVIPEPSEQKIEIFVKRARGEVADVGKIDREWCGSDASRPFVGSTAIEDTCVFGGPEIVPVSPDHREPSLHGLGEGTPHCHFRVKMGTITRKGGAWERRLRQARRDHGSEHRKTAPRGKLPDSDDQTRFSHCGNDLAILVIERRRINNIAPVRILLGPTANGVALKYFVESVKLRFQLQIPASESIRRPNDRRRHHC